MKHIEQQMYNISFLLFLHIKLCTDMASKAQNEYESS